MWFDKFTRLIYIAYLDCESKIKVVSLLFIGLLSGFLFIPMFIPTIPLPSDAAYVFYTLTTMGMMNAILVSAFLYVWLLITILAYSVFYVAYLYDGKSWGYVKIAKRIYDMERENALRIADKINNQAEIDKKKTMLDNFVHYVEISQKVDELKKG
jgi:Ca2+/Na+ antiporter